MQMMHNGSLASTAETPPSRALAVVRDPSGPDGQQGPRPLAGFLAQLIACEVRLPPYRERRRAGAREAACGYGERARRTQPPSRLQRVV